MSARCLNCEDGILTEDHHASWPCGASRAGEPCWNCARGRYLRERDDAKSNLRLLAQLVDAHPPTALNTNWSHVGNLVYLNDQLHELVQFLGGDAS